MYCDRCGRELVDNAKFCDGCGVRIKTKSENDSHPEKNNSHDSLLFSIAGVLLLIGTFSIVIAITAYSQTDHWNNQYFYVSCIISGICILPFLVLVITTLIGRKRRKQNMKKYVITLIVCLVLSIGINVICLW